jgi:hypothetical protein
LVLLHRDVGLDHDHLENRPDERPPGHPPEPVVPPPERRLSIEGPLPKVLGVKLAMVACAASCSMATVATAGHRQEA